MNLERRRKWINVAALGASMLAMSFGLVWLIWILVTVLNLGMHAISWTLFTESTPPPGSAGGLKNAIAGSALIVGLAMLIGTPVGILTGIYLGEYGQRSALGRATSFINDLLLSAPSIVIGLFIYAVYVTAIGNFSGFAGVLALALLVLPVVIRTTQDMLGLVPNGLREAAFALGAPKWRVITQISLRAAKGGIVTGVLLALARIAGETAPLLFTALSNQFWSLDLSKPMATLPATIFKFAMSPSHDWQSLAWAGVFLITVGVLLLNILARMLFNPSRQY